MLRWWPTNAALDPSAYYAASGERHGRGPPGAGTTMGVFIAWPWLALIPAAVFLAIYLLYPALVVISVAGAVAALRTLIAGHRRAP